MDPSSLKRPRPSSPPPYDSLPPSKRPAPLDANKISPRLSSLLPLPSSTADNRLHNANTNASASSAVEICSADQLLFRFDDGLVVFRIAGRPPSYLQASRSILTTMSPIFHDMLSPEKITGYKRFEGHPLVHVEDDPKELGYFLTAIHYHGDYFKKQRDDWRFLPEIFGILRIAAKYEVKHLQDKMIKQLGHDWPTTLKEFDALRDTLQPLEQHFMFLDVARAANVKRFLAVLLYLCAGTPSLSDIQQAPREHRAGRGGKEAVCFFSDPKDKDLCLIGREKIAIAAVRMIYGICLRKIKCDRSPHNPCSQKLITWVRIVAARPEFLCLPLSYDLDVELLDLDLCDTCYNVSMEDIREARNDFWEGLSEIFDLDD